MTAGRRLRARLICSLKAFSLRGSSSSPIKGAVADGLGEVVAQGVGVDVFEQHGGLGEALDAFVQIFYLLFLIAASSIRLRLDGVPVRRLR